ncbi:uncharacterized protein LOC108260624 [Ictalurus punctatus]|uniref:Uncharacterized protein LOC108260624 n=1 Tax=Ictalurus punctatus TaxID=7998 RepID=A0A2D0QFP4_ICTPU|nr:uncharacterized protein LOC108260624 [Ictalurus punctatus]
MADVCLPQWEDIIQWADVEELVLGPQNQFHPQLGQTTHSFLKVYDDAPGSPQPDNIDVKVFDPSKNTNIPIDLKITDTVDTLIKKYLQMRPELGNNLRLAFNGKPVAAHAILRDLGVKPGAVFITFQRCRGG